ncbi:DUF3324 domain-containing protein [Enterococcus rivorum]|uniref:DUF3324 domain-containing protein n=1 Tax=Enterococcus rivorum TaxID=762845 RepID=UPI0036261A56
MILKKKKKNNQQEGFSINNKLAYSVAIQLREEENMPKSNLILKKVTASQIAGKNVVKAQLQNPTPTIIDDVCYESSVTKKKNNDAVLHKQEVENYRVAPNTSYSFPISWDNQPFKAGEYSLHLKVKSIKNQEEWVFDQDFTISSEEAKQLNTSAVDLEKDYSIYIIYGSIVICVLLIILICLIKYFKKKKQTKKMEFKKKNHERKNDVKRNKKKSKPKSKPSC